MKKIIGITGGVGSGKSRILQILQTQYGAEIIQADKVAADLEAPGQPGLAELMKEFGCGILDETGALDRKRFAERIFNDKDALKKANDIIHPMTYAQIRRRTAESPAQIIAVEAALFTEESRSICTEMWFVDVSRENRIGRLMENRGYSREKCLSIMDNQQSRERFLKLADHVIDNNGSFSAAQKQIEAILGTAEG